jgi:flagellar motility protein MotE (MotC chaperone)
MKWLAIKTAFKKGWVWVKTHAWLPIMILLSVVGLLLYALTRNAAFMTAVIDAFEGQRESYKKEIEILNDTHKKEGEEKIKALDAYNENLKALEEEYAQHNEVLSASKKKELKKLVDESYNDPDKLAKELAELYGLERG